MRQVSTESKRESFGSRYEFQSLWDHIPLTKLIDILRYEVIALMPKLILAIKELHAWIVHAIEFAGQLQSFTLIERNHTSGSFSYGHWNPRILDCVHPARIHKNFSPFAQTWRWKLTLTNSGIKALDLKRGSRADQCLHCFWDRFCQKYCTVGNLWFSSGGNKYWNRSNHSSPTLPIDMIGNGALPEAD